MPYFVAFDHLPTGNDTTVQQAIGPTTLAAAVRSNFNTDLQISDGALSLGRRVVNIHANGSAHYTVRCESASLVIYGVRCCLLYSGTVPPSSAAAAFLKFENAAGTSRIELRHVINSTTVDVYANGVNVGSFTVAYNVWSYLEVAFKASTSTDGWVNVHLDGVEVLKVTGIQTVAAADIDHVKQQCVVSGSTPRSQFTDIYTKTATDDADAPGFYGPILMRLLNPTSDVAAAWTPSAGTDNYAMVDEDATDGDTTYIETNVITTEDQYGLENLPPGVNSVIAVCVGTLARAPNGGAPLVEHTLQIDGVKGTGTAQAIGTSAYRTQQHVFMLAPDGSALSTAKVDGSLIGVKAA